MSDFFWFSDAQWARIASLLPTDTRGMARVDDRQSPPKAAAQSSRSAVTLSSHPSTSGDAC